MFSPLFPSSSFFTWLTQSHPSGFGLNATISGRSLQPPRLSQVLPLSILIDAWAHSSSDPYSTFMETKCHLFGVSAALHVYTVRHRPCLDLNPRLTSLVGPPHAMNNLQPCQAPHLDLSFTVLPTVNWQIVGLSLISICYHLQTHSLQAGTESSILTQVFTDCFPPPPGWPVTWEPTKTSLPGS